MPFCLRLGFQLDKHTKKQYDTARVAFSSNRDLVHRGLFPPPESGWSISPSFRTFLCPIHWALVGSRLVPLRVCPCPLHLLCVSAAVPPASKASLSPGADLPPSHPTTLPGCWSRPGPEMSTRNACSGMGGLPGGKKEWWRCGFETSTRTADF